MVTPPASQAVGTPLALRHELARKSIHLATATIPVAYAAGLPRVWLLWLLTALCAAAVAAELGRSRHDRTRALVQRAAGRLFREHERARWSGATWLAVALLAAAVLFPRDVAVAAMWAVSVGDAAAAVVGRVVGRGARTERARGAARAPLPWGAPPELHDHPAPPAEPHQSGAAGNESPRPAPRGDPPAGQAPAGSRPEADESRVPTAGPVPADGGRMHRAAPKSLAGSLACAGAAAAGALLIAHLPPVESVTAAAVAALAERPRAPLDDNIRIVLAVGGALLLLRALGV